MLREYVDLRTSLWLFGLIFSQYLVRILYVVVICIPIRLHQSNQPHSLTCITFMICKYQVLYIIPCCNLQNTSFFTFSKVFLYDLIPIQKQRKYFKHSELSVLNALDLGWYSKQLNNLIQTKYNISMNQLFTVFVKDANISQISQYYQVFIV